ncbi:hypothetical protein K7X08_028857 [Anisodus acutangulus]|uniref:SMP domain-containing protein n=1 Tax=Anisodus acutangulus TaxID=402998 RepID=A0A9Q1L2X9_9SOLA|nr:hypothetical protein K7X08_028857 [Anisodus acutangulus]
MPVEYSDAAAIEAAEVRATGRTNIVRDGFAAAAQSAAARNARASRMNTRQNMARSSLRSGAKNVPGREWFTRSV